VGFEDRLLVGVVLAYELVLVPALAVGFDREAPLAPEEVGG
jgi:hypothetical protein